MGSNTKLDSHANMAIVGKDCTVFDTTGQTCTVNALTKSTGKLEKLIYVDAVVAQYVLIVLRHTYY